MGYMDDSKLLEPDPPFWTKTSWIQLGYGVWVNLTMISIGLAFGFSAVTLPQLEAPSSPIVITQKDGSWIAGVLTLSSPIGCVLCGYIMDKFGRRVVLLLCEVPMCVGWLYTGFANNANNIIIGRVITGIGVGMAMGAPRVYITEITLPNMRGLLGAFPNIALSLGITFLAALGSYLEWKMICYICGVYTLFIMCINYFLPESPHFLLVKGAASNIKNTLMKFRSSKFNIDAEIVELTEFQANNNIRRLSTCEQFLALFRPCCCKPFGIIIVYIIIAQTSGVTVIIMWAVEMFEESKSSMDGRTGNFVLGVTRVFSSVLMSILLFKLGRKTLAVASGLGVGISCILLCGYIYTSDRPTMYPLFFYVSYIIFASLGHYTLPFLMMYELYPLQVRGILGGISVSFLNILIFVMNKLYPLLRDKLGFKNTILTYGVCSLFGCIFLYIFLPETKDLTLQEIEQYYNDIRPTLTSQRRIMSMQLQQAVSRSVSTIIKKSNPKLRSSDKNKKENNSDKDLKVNKKQERKGTVAIQSDIVL